MLLIWSMSSVLSWTTLPPTNVPTSKPTSWNPVTCPARCRCYDYKYGNIVDCEGAGYKDIPTGIPDDSNILILEDNLLTTIPSSSLDRFTQLYGISFKNTNITSFPPHIFDKLSNLNLIDLRHNQLECCRVKDALANIEWEKIDGSCRYTDGKWYSLRDLTKGSTKGEECY